MPASHPPEPSPEAAGAVPAVATLATVRDYLIGREEQQAADAVAHVAADVATLVSRQAAGHLATRHLSELEGSLANLRAALHRAEALREVKS